MVDVGNFYNSVINDVIEGMKETFTQEGYDLDVLEQLRKLWSSKLAETHVTDPEPLTQPIIQFTQRIQPSQFPTVIGQQSMGIPIARLPIQPNMSGIRTLQPIGRPNAPLTTLSMGTGGPPTGLVLRSSLSGPMSGAPRPIMLAAALNPQNAQGVQQRMGNPNGQFTGITIRAPTNNPGQPGQATIIGQPMTGMNGVIQGQNVQFVQLGQQTLMLPLQLRQSAPPQQGTTTTTTATILPAPPHHHHQQPIQQQQQMHFQMQPQNQQQQHFQQQQMLNQQQQQMQQLQLQQQQIQQQQQSFNRTQLDGAGDGDSDFSDEDVDVLEPYSVETPLRTGPLSVAPASTPRLRGGGSSVQSKQPPSDATPSLAHLQQPPSSALSVLEDEDDSDDEGMVAATPGIFAPPTGTSSLFTPNPTPIPATPTPKRPISSTPNQVAGAGTNVSKRSRGEEDTFVEEDADIDSEEGEGDFGSVATMTPAAHRIETLVTSGSATPTTSRRKQKAPKGKLQQTAAEHAHIPDLPPPEKTKMGSGKKEQEDGVGGVDGAIASGDNGGGDKNGSGTGPKEQDDDDDDDDDEEEEEEEDEPLGSGDDVSDEDSEELFQSENLVVCQYDRVSRCRSKWRFWLHDGVMKIRGRDRLFQKMIVETDWLVDASFRP
ncbi:unnamed protein product [Hymenolepis diminuta]|uniref:Transcription initiation factor IIA subunit 1 n=1 Tax=Hymenolepis diminuta TaxID=6216 RepID=A0A564YQP3_HYMDI|nr:unnamed protein product [Hymenolepis diminuta]